mmetsp:Transcript_1010/g.4121  ORF Transcript_1010/g.4121 Transcript_1010/m.4121 type:complete len:90 (+) Transcript_1010:1298-1567(+)
MFWVPIAPKCIERGSRCRCIVACASTTCPSTDRPPSMVMDNDINSSHPNLHGHNVKYCRDSGCRDQIWTKDSECGRADNALPTGTIPNT